MLGLVLNPNKTKINGYYFCKNKAFLLLVKLIVVLLILDQKLILVLHEPFDNAFKTLVFEKH